MTSPVNLELKKKIERYSSAFTLSDMEIFIFPELFYSLLLANIMSPVIWKWLDDQWFKNIHKKNFTYKVNRIKQYIIQNYVFNLDLETWGLTTKEKEIDRFKDFFDISMLKKSNALFGYEGDKYYFSIQIRKHFGLDKYNDNIIPYWKTETVEAMNAFRYKDEYATGAGECVSLSSLYAAAMFIVGKIPLEKIFLMATPLHSQNFIIEKDGVITNNRRIVTKNMWFNGTSLSDKARRAIENEKVTIVSHLSGYIHTLYNKATINKDAYDEFSKKLNKYLTSEYSPVMFCNFLRTVSKYQKCFQLLRERNKKKYYIELEKIYHYEHSSKNTFSGNSRQALLNEIDADEYHLSMIDNRMILNDFEAFLNKNRKFEFDKIKKEYIENFDVQCLKMEQMFDDFHNFVQIEPRLPDSNKEFVKTTSLNISVDDSREDIIKEIMSKAEVNEFAELALYAYRLMDHIEWEPFIKASIERNPGSLVDLKGKNIQEVYNILNALDNFSIYDGNRLALPDEVWNYRRGDGIEKAILMAGYIKNFNGQEKIHVKINKAKVILFYQNEEFRFDSNKTIEKELTI